MSFITTYLFEDKKQVKEINWFRSALYLFLLYKVFVYVYQFKSLFSQERLIYHHPQRVNVVIDSVYFLNNHYSVSLGLFFIVAVLLLSIIGLFKRSNFISNIILWWLITNLTNFLYPTLTAGDFLLSNLLFFNCFFISTKSVKPVFKDLTTALHNSALIALKVQLCLGYFLAGYHKIIDESWINGSAIHTVFQIPEFSNPFLASIPYSVCMVLTYLTIAYQLSFAFLVWFRPFKIWLFLFGILQHLMIALGIGLFQFGMIMIICYILFLKYDYSSVNVRNRAEV